MEGIGVTVAVANQSDQRETFDLTFSVPDEELSKELSGVIMLHDFAGLTGSVEAADLILPDKGIAITEEGSVMVALDGKLYEKWVQGGKKGTGLTEVKSTNMSNNGLENNGINSNAPLVLSDRKMFELTGTTSSFDNITLEAGELRTTGLMILYPSDPVSDKQQFKYNIVQTKSDDGEVIGGVTYTINKPTNLDPATDAGNDRGIEHGCSTTLVASPQEECYAYFWLNDQGNVISKEASITVTPNQTTTFTLIIVSAEGFVSNDEVTVTVSNQQCAKEREIVRINPNPARDKVTVRYRVENTNNAHLRLVKTDNTVDRTYTLDLQRNQIMLDISSCTSGMYVITLVCDNVNEDAKSLLVQ
jgi:hypothetical protein